jgi:hypothetical protein
MMTRARRGAMRREKDCEVIEFKGFRDYEATGAKVNRDDQTSSEIYNWGSPLFSMAAHEGRIREN